MFTRAFWKAATERALKTGAEVLLLLLIGTKLMDTTGIDTPMVNAFKFDWTTAIGFAIGGIIISYLFSIISIGVGTQGLPTLLKPTTLAKVPELKAVEAPPKPPADEDPDA